VTAERTTETPDHEEALSEEPTDNLSANQRSSRLDAARGAFVERPGMRATDCVVSHPEREPPHGSTRVTRMTDRVSRTQAMGPPTGHG